MADNLLTLDDLRKYVDATRDLPGKALVVLSIPADYPPKPCHAGLFSARRLIGTTLRTEDDGTAYPKKDRHWLTVIEGRYDRDPATTTSCVSVGDIKTQRE